MLPVAVDAMGGDKAPGEIVAGAIRARDELGVPVVLVGRPDEIGDVVGPRGDRRLRGHRDGRRSRPQRPHDEGLVARPGGRGGPRRQGVGHGERRQHRRHDGQRAAAHGTHPRRGPTGHRHADPVPGRGHADRPARRRRQRGVPGRVARAVRPDGHGARPRALRRHRAPGRPAVHRRGARQGHRRWSRRPTLCWPTGPGRRRRGGTFVGNVEGRDIMSPDVDVVVTDGFTGNVALKTLEGGMRSLVDALLGRVRHRRGHPAAAETLDARPAARSTASSTRTTPAERCCSASTACASSATAPRPHRAVVNAVRVAGRRRAAGPHRFARARRSAPTLIAAGTPRARSQAGKRQSGRLPPFPRLPRSSSCPLRPMLSRAP